MSVLLRTELSTEEKIELAPGPDNRFRLLEKRFYRILRIGNNICVPLPALTLTVLPEPATLLMTMNGPNNESFLLNITLGVARLRTKELLSRLKILFCDE